MNKIFFCLLFLTLLSFSSEQDVISVLKSKSENYFALYKRAKLEVILSHPSCAPGDTVWLGIVYVNASDLKPVLGRQVVHICLFDQFGKKQLTRWAEVGNGHASSEMVIPKDFPSGNYKLVAFTDWMKNFDPSLFYQQQFTIVGKFSIRQVPPNDTLIFSTEGSALIAGIENNVAIRFNGKSTNTKVTIHEGEKELTSFRIIKDSVYVFRFAPHLNAKYTAEINNGNGFKRFQLPMVKESGIVLQVDASAQRIKLISEYSGNNLQGEDFYVAVFNNSGLIFQSHLDFDDHHKSNLLLPSTLPRGIAQLAVFDSKFNLMTTRVIYYGDTINKKASLGNLQESYSTRTEVKLNMQVRDKDGFTIPGYFTCRVVNADLFPDSKSKEMDFLTFESDISTSFKLNRVQATQQTINNYLITQSCPWFDWNRIIKNERTILLKPQQNLTLSGMASHAKNGKHVADSTLLMFFLEKSLLGYETRTDKKGNFSFPLLLAVNHPDRFYYTGSLKGKDVDDITVQMNDADSAFSFFANPWMVDNNSVDPYASYSAQVQTINNSYSFFMNSMPTDSVEEPNKAMEEELNGADLTVNLSDFLMMPSMQDVVREIVKNVEYRKISGREVIRVYTTGKITNYSSGPLFVIDGAITKDPSYFLSLKPADVISIKVVRDSKKLFALGSLGANGVILVKTRLGMKMVKEKHMLDFAGLLPEFHNHSWGFSNPKIPDLRPCLFWTSKTFNGKDNESLFFRSSDDVGKFKIQVSGLTEDGIPFYSEHLFHVKYPGN